MAENRIEIRDAGFLVLPNHKIPVLRLTVERGSRVQDTTLKAWFARPDPVVLGKLQSCTSVPLEIPGLEVSIDFQVQHEPEFGERDQPGLLHLHSAKELSPHQNETFEKFLRTSVAQK